MPGRTKQNASKPSPAAIRSELTRGVLADIYAEKYTTFEALRTAMVQRGIVEHRISPYDVIQRAIDDTFTDYMLLRRQIEKEVHGDPTLLVNHPLYDWMEHMREASVRYATFAVQYDIAKRQLGLSEARVALLAHTLRSILTTLGIHPDVIQQVPQLLINELTQTPIQPRGNSHDVTPTLSPIKAEAIAEILHNDAAIVIEPDTPE